MADRANGILLDTSAVVAHLRGVLNIRELTAPSEELFISLVALGELYKGVEKSKRASENRKLVDQCLEWISVLYPDEATAEVYAKTAATLERKGLVIPENDLWIAAVALELDMPLATRDRHFDRVEGLTVIHW